MAFLKNSEIYQEDLHTLKTKAIFNGGPVDMNQIQNLFFTKQPPQNECEYD